MTLTEFLLARIAEDREELATSRYVAEDHWWLPDCAARARLEDENEAKRRIVALHNLGEPWSEAIGELLGSCATCAYQTTSWPCATLRALALPYADHPDYRVEWKPYSQTQRRRPHHPHGG